ncbi:hypothetical protein [Streptomyces sp. NPDC055099]
MAENRTRSVRARTLRAATVTAATAATLALALPAHAAPFDPSPGADGVGDPLFPTLGNGGYDVEVTGDASVGTFLNRWLFELDNPPMPGHPDWGVAK